MPMQQTPATFTSDKHVVFTGPVTGDFTLDDGTVVNVSPVLVEVETPEHAAELADKIGRHLDDNGHPEVPDFKYVPPDKVAKTVARSLGVDVADVVATPDPTTDETPED